MTDTAPITPDHPSVVRAAISDVQTLITELDTYLTSFKDRLGAALTHAQNVAESVPVPGGVTGQVPSNLQTPREEAGQPDITTPETGNVTEAQQPATETVVEPEEAGEPVEPKPEWP